MTVLDKVELLSFTHALADLIWPSSFVLCCHSCECNGQEPEKENAYEKHAVSFNVFEDMTSDKEALSNLYLDGLQCWKLLGILLIFILLCSTSRTKLVSLTCLMHPDDQ